MENDHSCRAVGRCVAGLELDREVGDMIPNPDEVTERRFLYARFDVETSSNRLEEMGLSDIAQESLAMDNVDAVWDMKRIGEKLGEQVDS